MNRSHMIRLNTTPEQALYFRKACGVARHAYNWALAHWKEARAKGERVKLKDLKVKGMQALHCLAQAVSDASFFEVKRQLLYKAEQYGGSVQLVSRWYPSSKTCHYCGWVKQDLTLADRVWVCEQCGAVNERDVNASLNVRDEALRLITDVPVVASSERKIACGAGSSGSFESETFCCEAGTKVL